MSTQATKKTAVKKMAGEQTDERGEIITISPPKIEVAEFLLRGTAPLVQLRFSEKSIQTMKAKHLAGSTANKSKAREKRDFDEEFRQAQHRSTDGWLGVPCGAFRAAMISACRLVGFKMTLAKLSVFIEPDGFDRVDSVPLVRVEGEPEPLLLHVRNATGVADLRMRAKIFPWSCRLNVRYDLSQFTRQDIANLVARIGLQVGIGEGRHDSKASCGMGWGTFTISND